MRRYLVLCVCVVLVHAILLLQRESGRKGTCSIRYYVLTIATTACLLAPNLLWFVLYLLSLRLTKRSPDLK